MIMTLKLGNEMKEIPINPIRHARVKHGLTQQQLADLTGIPKRTIENWEAGQRKCPDYVTKMVVDLLDQADYKAIVEDVVDALERDLDHLKTDEARNLVTNLITGIKDSLKA